MVNDARVCGARAVAISRLLEDVAQIEVRADLGGRLVERARVRRAPERRGRLWKIAREREGLAELRVHADVAKHRVDDRALRGLMRDRVDGVLARLHGLDE